MSPGSPPTGLKNREVRKMVHSLKSLSVIIRIEYNYDMMFPNFMKLLGGYHVPNPQFHFSTQN